MRTVKEKVITTEELVKALKGLGVVPENARVTFNLGAKDVSPGVGQISLESLTISLEEENDSDELFKL